MARRTRCRCATIRYLIVLATSLCCSCIQGSRYWAAHPDSLRVSALHYDVEPVFNTLPASSSGVPYEIQIVLQNDSDHLIAFAEYAANERKWFGDGFTVAAVVAEHSAIESIDVDYANVSGLSLWSGEDASDRRPLIVRLILRRDEFVIDAVRTIKLTIDVVWQMQDCDGLAVGPTRTARFYPELVLIGRVGPRPVSTPGK